MSKPTRAYSASNPTTTYVRLATLLTIVPMSAEATAKPSQKSLRTKTRCSDSVVPEMTAVSNPNSRPPSAATSELNTTGVRDFAIFGLALSGKRLEETP